MGPPHLHPHLRPLHGPPNLLPAPRDQHRPHRHVPNLPRHREQLYNPLRRSRRRCTVEHADVAVAIALLGLSGYIGGAIGNAISGAIWTNTLPDQLMKRLPKEAKGQVEAIYGSLKTQLSYPPGSPVRDAIVDAYATAQTRMLIAGIVATGIMLVLTVFLKNVRLNENRHVKGTVL